MKSGDRIAIVGHNGCGKSSLLRQLWHSWQQGDSPLFHPRARVGYYDQSLQQLRDDQTLSAALHGFAALSDEQCKMALISAGFPGCAISRRLPHSAVVSARACCLSA